MNPILSFRFHHRPMLFGWLVSSGVNKMSNVDFFMRQLSSPVQAIGHSKHNKTPTDRPSDRPTDYSNYFNKDHNVELTAPHSPSQTPPPPAHRCDKFVKVCFLSLSFSVLVAIERSLFYSNKQAINTHRFLMDIKLRPLATAD